MNTIPSLCPRYYSPKELADRGIEHVKIQTEGHVVPSSRQGCLGWGETLILKLVSFRVVEQFYSAVKSVLNQEGEDLVGVHCTHGLNRCPTPVLAFLTFLALALAFLTFLVFITFLAGVSADSFFPLFSLTKCFHSLFVN